MSCYLRQASVPGNWSAYSLGERHRHFMGLACYDMDFNLIKAPNHMRYINGGVDSKTTLAAPLTPGDTSISVADASGWNDSETQGYRRGVIIFGYQNSLGATYDFYSRLYALDLFDLPGVDKPGNTINLKTPFPASLANPNDPNGTWPVGTALANSNSGATYNYHFLHNVPMTATDTWNKVTNYVGGVDFSGTNYKQNFPAGTAFVKVFWMPNYTNRVGGLGTSYPDTGAGHALYCAGLSITEYALVTAERNAQKRVDIQVASLDPAGGGVLYAPAAVSMTNL